MACHDLLNQSYCIENIAYPKEEYIERKREYLASIRDHDARYEALARHPSANPGSTGSTGRHLVDCTDVEN